MKAWKHSIRVGHLWAARRRGEITIQQLAESLADRLQLTPYAEDLDSLCDDLRNIEDVEEFDSVLEEIYEYADEDKRLWIDTLDPPLEKVESD